MQPWTGCMGAPSGSGYPPEPEKPRVALEWGRGEARSPWNGVRATGESRWSAPAGLHLLSPAPPVDRPSGGSREGTRSPLGCGRKCTGKGEEGEGEGEACASQASGDDGMGSRHYREFF